VLDLTANEDEITKHFRYGKSRERGKIKELKFSFVLFACSGPATFELLLNADWDDVISEFKTTKEAQLHPSKVVLLESLSAKLKREHNRVKQAKLLTEMTDAVRAALGIAFAKNQPTSSSSTTRTSTTTPMVFDLTTTTTTTTTTTATPTSVPTTIAIAPIAVGPTPITSTAPTESISIPAAAPPPPTVDLSLPASSSQLSPSLSQSSSFSQLSQVNRLLRRHRAPTAVTDSQDEVPPPAINIDNTSVVYNSNVHNSNNTTTTTASGTPTMKVVDLTDD
jgi:hypothetical protein